MADIMRDPRPSGIVLPRILRKKLLHQEREEEKKKKLHNINTGAENADHDEYNNEKLKEQNDGERSRNNN